MNQAASKNVENLKKVTDEVVVTNDELYSKFSKWTKTTNLQSILINELGEVAPLMKELKEIETTVNKLEYAAYRLDAFTLRLEEKINAYLLKNK